MTKIKRLTIQDWVNAGLFALAEHGPAALKAEPLARGLGTTKGSFYWHFKDIPAFHAALLAYWEEQATTEIVERLDALPDPRQRLRTLGQIAASPPPAEVGGQKLEPAIRAWAHSDQSIAQAVKRVDQNRLAFIANQLSTLGLSNPEFPQIIYAAYIGLDDMTALHKSAEPNTLITLIDLILSLE